MPGLTRRKQIGFKLNGSEGVAETLSAADYVATLSDVSHSPNPDIDPRGQLKATLSPTAQLVGCSVDDRSWTEELAGGDETTAARWENLLRACGFRTAVTLKYVEVGSLTGTEFKPHDLLGDNTALASVTKTVRFVTLFTVGASTFLVYEPLTGSALANTDTLYKYNASGTSVGNRPVDSSPTDAGRRYRPLSYDGSTSSPDATLIVREAGQVWTYPSVRGNATLVFERGATAKMQCTMRGPAAPEADGSIAEAGLVSGVGTAGVPIMVGRIGFPIVLDTFKPVATGITVELGNTLSDRPTINDGGILGFGGQPMGYMPTWISDRKPMIKIPPEHVAKATFDFVGKFFNGSTFVFQAGHGKPTDAGGRICVTAPAAQIVNAPTVDDRDGIEVRNLDLLCTGTDDDEIYIDVIRYIAA